MNDYGIRKGILAVTDVAAQMPQVQQMVGRLMRQYRRRSYSMSMAQRLGWLGAGIAVGTGLVALLTPENGRQVRRRLTSQARRMRKYVAQTYNGAAEEAPRAARSA